MRLPTLNDRLLPSFLFSLLVLIIVGCDQGQSVFLTAEDFRFVPDVVRVHAATPLVLTVYNAGREVHEFDSPVLIYTNQTEPAKTTHPGIPLEPGKSIEFSLAPPQGTYLYTCRRKGHANMTGTLIIE